MTGDQRETHAVTKYNFYQVHTHTHTHNKKHMQSDSRETLMYTHRKTQQIQRSKLVLRQTNKTHSYRYFGFLMLCSMFIVCLVYVSLIDTHAYILIIMLLVLPMFSCLRLYIYILSFNVKYFEFYLKLKKLYK